MNKTGIVYHPVYLKHETNDHPEKKERLTAALEKIKSGVMFPETLPSHGSPGRLAPKPISNALQAPDRMELTISEVLEHSVHH